MLQKQKPLPFFLYIIGVVVIFISVAVPYFVDLPGLSGYLVVYGLPILVVSLFFGKQILSRAAKNNKEGFKYGLGLFGSFYVIGIFFAMIALFIIIQFNPSAPELLQKPNPVLNVPPNVAWIMIAVSMLIIGPAEEYLFRGFVYGGMLNLSKGKHWLPLAVVSGLMFAFAHGYYALTYGSASPVFFIELTTFGIGMSMAYYWSGGNIVALAVIHGLNNTVGFLTVAANQTVGRAALTVLVAIGLVFAIYYVVLKKIRINPTPAPDNPADTGNLPPPPPAS